MSDEEYWMPSKNTLYDVWINCRRWSPVARSVFYPFSRCQTVRFSTRHSHKNGSFSKHDKANIYSFNFIEMADKDERNVCLFRSLLHTGRYTAIEMYRIPLETQTDRSTLVLQTSSPTRIDACFFGLLQQPKIQEQWVERMCEQDKETKANSFCKRTPSESIASMRFLCTWKTSKIVYEIFGT